ncbi:hypothetical protein THAOC_09880 [Thalassiosira oceanica]|uniref:Uncharacterized protein n=1 Tax=Thalassiosira oceanica TaxID=159749 RepID=K0T6F3_THAOC|nr:hypothetical protein THAOC_09880 [Thalassiosira oceanica]|eukprot:EJK68906.1 hypothetical protein THAOC_09880 [Thalassiosira oceanica]
MLGKVRNPYMQRFFGEGFPGPDAGVQRHRTYLVGARTDVLGEVKTLQPSKTSYDKGNCQTNRPVNLRATQAVRSYRRRAAGLNQKYAQEVVGDGTNGQVGPFETALGEFYTGNALPVAVSAFSEVNEDASKLITRLSRLTAKTDFGKSMSPLVSHSRKGGAFPIIQSQFRRALGCLIARGQAQHLLKRRHYATPTAREAYQTAEDNHSRNRNRPRASMSGYARWWQNFIPEGYVNASGLSYATKLQHRRTTQASNDSGLGGRTDILDEVKTMQPSKTSYCKGNCQVNKPVDQSTKQVKSGTTRREPPASTKKYAPEMVGDGTNSQVGPFETALGELYTSNVLPIAVGAFGGEDNEDARPQQERGRIPNHADPVQACPRVLDRQGAAGTAPTQKAQPPLRQDY